MAKVNAKNSNKNLVMVIVLLVILLLAAVVTNDRARQFLTNSSADNGCRSGLNCDACGSPRARQACWAAEEEALGRKIKSGVTTVKPGTVNSSIFGQMQDAWNNFIHGRSNDGDGFKGGKTLTNPR